jgi:hypothetical protein
LLPEETEELQRTSFHRLPDVVNAGKPSMRTLISDVNFR